MQLSSVSVLHGVAITELELLSLILESIVSDEEYGSLLDELFSEEDDFGSLDVLSSDEDEKILLDELFSEDEDLSSFTLEEFFSDEEDLSFFMPEELCEDDDSVFLLEELSFTEEDDVLVCFTLDELAFAEDDFAELEEVFSLLEDSTSCSREELDSTNSGWVEELLELSSPQDTNRQTALNGINNRFNMDFLSLLQVLIDQYIHFLDLFHPASDKLTAIMQKSPVFGQGFYGCSEVC